MNRQIVMIGFGSIGQALLPLLIQEFALSPSQISIITADNRGRTIAEQYGIDFTINPLTENNYQRILDENLTHGDLLINVSVEVSSVALIRACHELGVLYIDTCIEPWRGGYTDPSLSLADRTNYKLREDLLILKRELNKGPTAVSSHGANPGLISHWYKQALLNIAQDQGLNPKTPKTREEWANLSKNLGVKVVHCAERDTQITARPKQPNEFVNTWSVDGFISEGCQAAELGWGTHEKQIPHDGNMHQNGCCASIYLKQPGFATRIRSWTPLEGHYHGFLITHNESISIADYFSVFDENGKIIYRPTVHYAYHPCNDAILSIHEIKGRNLIPQESGRILSDEIVSGVDELGILMMGDHGAYWYGSRVSIEEARSLIPHNNATSIQVIAGILGGITWALQNPFSGVVEPEEMSHQIVLDVAKPYLGEVIGTYTDWTPLTNRATLFDEALDTDDPWQFINYRVS